MVISLNGQVVELLLKEKADPNIQNNDGRTALMVASRNGHQQVVELLLKEKADPNIQNNDGRTALIVASQNGHQQVVELLLKEKADPNIQNNDGWTALMVASQNGHHQVVELLLKEKADPNIQDNDGRTALMVASQNGHQQVVELLLKEKADPNIQDNDGRTALMVASQNGHQQVVELLLKEKADPNIQDNDGWTALHGSIKETNTEELHTVANADTSKEMVESLHQEYTHGEDTSSHQFDSKKAQEKEFGRKHKETKKKLVNEDEQSNEMNYTIGSKSSLMQEKPISTLKSMLSDSIRNPFSSFKKQKRKKKFLHKNITKKMDQLTNSNAS